MNRDQIEKLITRASQAISADDAMKYSQAAVNAAKARALLNEG